MEDKDILGLTEEAFNCHINDIRDVSPLMLAYIGDCAYEIVIRSYVVAQGDRQVNKLHKETIGLVNAATQSAIIEVISSELTEEEESVYKRGRNAKSGSSAKNASIVDYRRATGFEALMGYLYLKGDMRRMVELIQKGISNLPENGRQ